jgi:hypothetical protein
MTSTAVAKDLKVDDVKFIPVRSKVVSELCLRSPELDKEYISGVVERHYGNYVKAYNEILGFGDLRVDASGSVSILKRIINRHRSNEYTNQELLEQIKVDPFLDVHTIAHSLLWNMQKDKTDPIDNIDQLMRIERYRFITKKDYILDGMINCLPESTVGYSYPKIYYGVKKKVDKKPKKVKEKKLTKRDLLKMRKKSLGTQKKVTKRIRVARL